MGRRSVWWVPLTVFSLGLPACTPDENLAAEYLRRIVVTLDAPTPGLRPSVEPLQFPSRRERRYDVPPVAIDGAQFVALHACDLGGLVGYRNSPLGRIFPPSRILAYNVELVAEVERCSARSAAPRWLEQLAAERRERLLQLCWNAIVGGGEWDRFLGAAGISSDSPAHALAELTGQRQSASGFDVGRFELTLRDLAASVPVGRQRATWRTLRDTLDAVSALVRDHAPRVCRNGRPTPLSRIMVNVFARYFVAGMGDSLAREGQVAEGTLAGLTGLFESLPATPAAREWLDGLRRDWVATRVAVVDHATTWTALFDRCGMRPDQWRTTPAFLASGRTT